MYCHKLEEEDRDVINRIVYPLYNTPALDMKNNTMNDSTNRQKNNE